MLPFEIEMTNYSCLEETSSPRSTVAVKRDDYPVEKEKTKLKDQGSSDTSSLSTVTSTLAFQGSDQVSKAMLKEITIEASQASKTSKKLAVSKLIQGADVIHGRLVRVRGKRIVVLEPLDTSSMNVAPFESLYPERSECDAAMDDCRHVVQEMAASRAPRSIFRGCFEPDKLDNVILDY